MKITAEIENISPRVDDTIDFNTLIFRIEAGKRINMDNSNELWIFLKTLIEGGAKKMLLDLGKTEFIDSSGIGVLINSAKLLRQKKGDIVLSGASSEIRDIFKIINLQDFIRLYKTDVEALNSFRFV